MSTFLLLTITGLGLGAMYFLIASGLSLIYGLMGVLNFAHGVFLTVTAYALWFTESKLGGIAVLPRFLIAALVGIVVVSPTQEGATTTRASLPQIAVTSAVTESASPTVTSTCSI